MPAASIVYVMGPSGAGKTRVIDYARQAIDGRLPVAFAHRYITRPAGEDDENHVALTPREFQLRKSHGLFAFDWEAHGYAYGIGVEIRAWLAAGLTVVIDGSRAHFSAAGLAGDGLIPVLITAEREALRQRLERRGREDAAAIEERLARAAEFVPRDPALRVIDNAGPIERAGEAFTALLRARAATS